MTIPLSAQLVDQQAALAGSGAVRPGELKATYGTGVFVLGRTRDPLAASGLLPTVAWAHRARRRASARLPTRWTAACSRPARCSTGSPQGLGLAVDAAALAAAAAEVEDSDGVIVLPALAGLGAPWWRPAARGVIAGLHPAVGAAHVARAALEAIAWRVADIVEAMAVAGPIHELRVDGGLTNDQTLLQIQADALGLPLTVGPPDATVLGAAMLAGVGAGMFASVEEAAERLPRGRVVAPRVDANERSRQRERWRAFVQAAGRLGDGPDPGG